MPWVKFNEDFDFHPKAEPRVTVAYKAGASEMVTRECAKVAVKAKAAVLTTKPKDGSQND